MSVQMSRRKMIMAGGAVLAAPMVLAGDGRADAQVSRLSASDRAVSAIAGSDPGFDDAAEALYPGLRKDPTFRQIAPLSLLVTHQQGPSVRAFSVSWAVTTPSGSYETPLYYYVSLGPPATGHTLSALGSARRNIVPAGQSRLVTPFFHWTPADYQSKKAVDWKTAIEPTDPGEFLVSELPKATQMKPSLDAVIFTDWKMIGPNKHKLGTKIRARRNAEHDEGVAVLRLMKKGASDSEIVQTLREHGAAPRSNNTSLNARWYEQSRRLHAQILLRAFQDSDRSNFKNALVRLKTQRKTVITRLPA
jgi:hypothetical protein